jgi:hypothetical protein
VSDWRPRARSSEQTAVVVKPRWRDAIGALALTVVLVTGVVVLVLSALPS